MGGGLPRGSSCRPRPNSIRAILPPHRGTAPSQPPTQWCTNQPHPPPPFMLYGQSASGGMAGTSARSAPGCGSSSSRCSSSTGGSWTSSCAGAASPRADPLSLTTPRPRPPPPPRRAGPPVGGAEPARRACPPAMISARNQAPHCLVSLTPTRATIAVHLLTAARDVTPLFKKAHMSVLFKAIFFGHWACIYLGRIRNAQPPF